MTGHGQYLEAFALGNGAILTNVCVLPLYPGLIAFLAGTSSAGRANRGQAFLGLLVLAGVLSMMIGLGFVLYLLNRSFSSILDWLLPLIYGTVAALGLAMIAGRNPFSRISSSATPFGRTPALSAYSYGLLLGPMTLPCAGPLVISAFVLGAGSSSSLAEGLLYFLAFGFGFGWPLVALPIVAAPLQRRVTRWLATHAVVIGRISGAALVAIALYGLWTEYLPNLNG
ncbi:MAG: cytochrome c biogenesis CcdA family protein [Thermomicrobiales bacterium]